VSRIDVVPRMPSHVESRRRRPANAGLLTLWIAFVTALAFTAPLAHAHLDAAQAATHGLCGDHDPSRDAAPDPCTLCLAGGHAPGSLPRAAGCHATPSRPAIPASEAPAPIASAPARRPGAPRAPPLSA
jgi:hypothetical protein